MKLTKLKIEDFKRVASVEIELADVNILVGANASGKSSIVQAIHLACCVMRQASRVESGKTSTVGIEELDYLPTDNYKMLGHRGHWGNKDGTSSSKVSLTFKKDADEHTASCELRSARNAGISITGSVPSSLTELLRRRQNFFSAYIPGISGIPNKEEKKAKKVILKACSYGDSNIILRNVLLLLKLQDAQNINLIEQWIGQILGSIKIMVGHNDDKDFFINCNVQIDGYYRPIELIGTGYLQLIQIFSYVLLFKPGILLIDEPDIHLHPNIQEKLVKVLALVASQRNLRILLTTHSPFIVRGAPPSTKVYWVKDGRIESQNRLEVEMTLGWGAFGKRIILISEDNNISLLRKIIAQWPEIDKFISFYPGMGFTSIPSPIQAAEISRALGGKYKIFIHRDRDSLTDNEVERIKREYSDNGTYLWFPEYSDIEAYFCEKQFLQDFIGCTEDQADQYINDILTRNLTTIKDQFIKQRTTHNKELYAQGGSPTNDDVWNGFQPRYLKGAKGKYIFRQLKNIIPGNAFREETILQQPFHNEIATDLKAELEGLLRS